MKKILGILMLFILVGCVSDISKEQNNETPHWDGTYVCESVALSIEKEDIDENGFVFVLKKGDSVLTNYAFFKEDNPLNAIYDIEEDGHTLIFTLESDQIIVEELEGPSILGVDLTGQYKKK